MKKGQKSLTGNIGEWSEIYVLLRLLATGKMEIADDELNAIPDKFYVILAAIRQEVNSLNRYVREDGYINIRVAKSGTGEVESFNLPRKVFEEQADNLLLNLQGRGFKSHQPKTAAFLHKIHIHKVQQGSGSKRDITLEIKDTACELPQTFGFSIKSFLGGDSSLFNAGAGSNFIYEIQLPANTEFDIDEFNKVTYKKRDKIAPRINKLINEYGATLKFEKIQSDCFSQNLRTIDGDLPELMAHLLLIRNRHRVSDIKSCVKILEKENPLDFNILAHGSVYEYKIKRFLHDCALGMVIETPWTGIYDASGGQIIVKGTGQILCYHIYEINRFQKYLFENTYFETASTSEDENNPGHAKTETKSGKMAKPFKYGWVYEEDGKLKIKLNLQIRFK